MSLRSNQYILSASVFTAIGVIIWNVYFNNILLEDSLFIGITAFVVAGSLHLSWRSLHFCRRKNIIGHKIRENQHFVNSVRRKFRHAPESMHTKYGGRGCSGTSRVGVCKFFLTFFINSRWFW